MGWRGRVAVHTGAGLVCGGILGIGWAEAGIVGVVATPFVLVLLLSRRQLVIAAATVIAMGGSWIAVSVPAVTNTDPAVTYPFGALPLLIGVVLTAVGLALWAVASHQLRTADGTTDATTAAA